MDLNLKDNLTSKLIQRYCQRDLLNMGDPIAFTFMFQDNFFVFSTEKNYLIGVEIESGHHFYMTFEDSFVTCLDFEESKGVLVAGMSNNLVAFIDPRNYCFSILRTFIDFSLYALITIKVIDKLNKIIMTNSANEIWLAERISKKSFKKYKARIVSRIGLEKTVIHEIKVEEFPSKEGSLIAFISVDRVRIVWATHKKKFKITLIDIFSFSDLTYDKIVNSKSLQSKQITPKMNSEIKSSIQDNEYFKITNLIMNKNEIDEINNKGKKKKSKKKIRVGLGLNELKLILKKKNRALLCCGGILLISQSSEDKIYSQVKLGKH